MTTAELISNFSYLLDERGSPNLEDDEILVLLNAAQLERLRRLIPDDQGGLVNFDFDRNTLGNIQTLIYSRSITPVAADSGTEHSVITNTAMETAVIAAGADAGSKVYRVTNLKYDSKPIKYISHNKLASYQANYFKAPSESTRYYTLVSGGLRIFPALTQAVNVTMIKAPRILTAGNSPEWNDQNCNLIISIALQLASQATRDGELLSTIQNSNVAK